MPKEHMAALGAAITPIEILLPLLVSRWTAGPRPLQLCVDAYLPRMAIGLVGSGLVYAAMVSLELKAEFAANEWPWRFYGLMVIAMLLHGVAMTAMFVSQMAFFAQISDPAMGGTYMTLLNTFSNLGSKWPNMLVLSLVDFATVKEGREACTKPVLGMANRTEASAQCAALKAEGCKWFKDMNAAAFWAAPDACDATRYDGFFVLTAACTAMGGLWFATNGSRLQRLQELPDSAWRVAKGKKAS